MGAELEALEDLLGVALVLLEVEGGAEAVGADDAGVGGEGELDEGDEAGEAALPRGHLLAHHAGVAVAEEEDEAALRDALGEELGGFFDGGALGAEGVEKRARLLVVAVGGGLAHRRTISTR